MTILIFLMYSKTVVIIIQYLITADQKQYRCTAVVLELVDVHGINKYSHAQPPFFAHAQPPISCPCKHPSLWTPQSSENAKSLILKITSILMYIIL